MNTWLLFLYKVPHEPSSRRVFVWRKLKRLGAVLLHDSAWALPMSPAVLEQFQVLAVEIAEIGGESLLLEAQLVPGEKSQTLAQVLLTRAESLREQEPLEVQ
ncbi:MAG TPA: Chromate resistance protein ChrB [Ktedonobacteraceae bacterium]|nr:Chromate resistance protein ChrB [Ktedonobacteraceae bacterium]